MNPNKKDNNGWILCPSKSFPGKLYYFNVLTGEAAWSLNDPEHKEGPKDNIQNIQKADKSHTYPEPSSPPREYPNPFSFHMPKPVQKIIRRFDNVPQTAPQTGPMFGQAIFPTYISNVDPYMHNIVWAPIQLPMFPPKPIQDQGIQSWEPNRSILVQSCNIPLSKRFTSEPKTNVLQSGLNSQVFGQPSLNNNQVKSCGNLSNFPSTSQNFRGIINSQKTDRLKISKHNTQDKSNNMGFNDDAITPMNGQVFNVVNINDTFDLIKKGARQRTQSESDSIAFYDKNDDVSPHMTTHDQVLNFGTKNNNISHTIKKVERQRTQSESSTVIDFHDNNNAVKPSNDRIFNIVSKNNNFDTIKKVGRQRTLSDSDSVIFEKSKCGQVNTVFKPNFEPEKQNDESSDMRSGFILRKPVLNLNTNIHTFQFKSSGHIENKRKDKKENSESSLWCNQEKSFLKNDIRGTFMGNTEKGIASENKKSHFLRKLDANDLRHTLEKKRKCIDAGRMHPVTENLFKTPDVNANQQPAVKKRVVFDLPSSQGSSETNGEYNENQSPTTTPLSLNNNNGSWYIVVDTQVLLDDYDFIDKFVLLDKNCKLFIAHAVQSEIERFCFGDCRGQRRVIVARQITRRLATPPRHIFVQPADIEDEMFSKMSTGARILNCCMQLLQQGDHVVLVTDDPKLYEKAETLKINCFKLEEIKGVLNPNTTSSKPQKIMINNENTHKLFLQNKHDQSNMKIPVDNNKNTLFNKERGVIQCDERTDKKTTDANTSPIKFEETVVKKKKKSRDYLNFSYDSESESVISKTMEKLVIKDNGHYHNEKSNELGEKNSFTFEIKKKKNINPQNEGRTGQLHNFDNSKIESAFSTQKSNHNNSKIESAFSTQKSNMQFQIQTKNVTDQKEVETNKRNKTLAEQLKSSIIEKLKRFQVTSKFMQENIRSNIEEWICTYRQLMEHALTAFLQDNPKESYHLAAPWSLVESVPYVSCVLPTNSPAAACADELSCLLMNNCSKQGDIKRDIEPEEFIRVFGCGVLLVEYLQSSGSNPSISDSQQLLRDMLRRMQHGSEIIELVQSPVLRGDSDQPARHNFAKKTSDILNYLKCHFPAWRGYTESPIEDAMDEVITHNENKIVRTFGRNLNLLTIDHKKSMTMKNNNTDDRKNNFSKQDSSEPNISDNTYIHSQSTVKIQNEPNVVRIFDKNTPFPKKKITTTDNVDMTPKHENTFGFQESAGPKVIRNIILIDEFEEKLKTNTLNEISTNYETFSTDVSLCTSNNDFVYDKNVSDLNNDTYDISFNDKHSFNDNKEQNNDSDKPNDSSTNDSGFVNENDTYMLLQTFFSELSCSMKLIYGFVDESMKEYRKAELQSGKKKSIFEKATIAHGHLTGIIYKLKCIIQRESEEVTPLKEMIAKADVFVVEDKRLMKHRQVVSKCLEQAQILEGSLKLLLAISEGDFDITPGYDRQTFLNIFE